MADPKTEQDYSSTLLRYQPGKGWSPIDYANTPDLDVPVLKPAQLEKDSHAAPVIQKKVVSLSGTTHAPPPVETAQSKKSADLSFSDLEDYIATQSRGNKTFGLHALEAADLETLGERLPEIFEAVDAYAKEASQLSWVDIAQSIQDLQHSREERNQYQKMLAALDVQIAEMTETLKANLKNIEKQERAKTAAARLKERLSLHTAQVLSQRIQTLLDKP